MNITKVVLGVSVSTFFTASTLALTSYLIKDSGSGDFIDFGERFNLLVGAIYGAVTGAIAGAIISGLNINTLTGAVFGLLYNLFLGAALVFLAAGGGWGSWVTKVYCTSIIIGIINGAIIPLINTTQSPLK